MNKNLSELRTDYNQPALEDSLKEANPWHLFETWFEEALLDYPSTANACTLSTCGSDGFPKGRIVLLKEYTPKGLVFFTSYQSQKGIAISENPKGTLSFYWEKLFRQVLFTGTIETISREKSEEYFLSRPIESQVSGCISSQSQVIENREVLEKEYSNLMNSKKEMKCPEDWGGYLLKPKTIEFWQGREKRLHDRLEFTFTEQGIECHRLAP